MILIETQEVRQSLSAEHVVHGPPSSAILTVLPSPLLLPPLSAGPLSVPPPLPLGASLLLLLGASSPPLLPPLVGRTLPSLEPFHGALLPHAMSRPTAIKEPTIVRCLAMATFARSQPLTHKHIMPRQTVPMHIIPEQQGWPLIPHAMPPLLLLLPPLLLLPDAPHA